MFSLRFMYSSNLSAGGGGQLEGVSREKSSWPL